MAVVDRKATFTDASTEISSMEVALCLQSVAVVDRQDTFTYTSTTIRCMVMARWLQSVTRGLTSHFHRYFNYNKLQVMVMWLWSVTVVDQQATFTDTSTGISSMKVTLCL